MCPTHLSNKWSDKDSMKVVRPTLPAADVSVRLHARFCGGPPSSFAFTVVMLVMTSRPPGIMKAFSLHLDWHFKLVLYVLRS